MLFSIIMPAYNAEKFLRKSIQSVLMQTVKDWELIIVDDGSKDNTYNLALEFAEKDTRINCLQQANSGPGEARNNAIRHSKGDYLAFLDSDDYWENYFLEKVANEIKSNNNEIIFYDRFYEDENGNVFKVGNISRFKNMSKDSLIKSQMTGIVPWGMSKVIKREIVIGNNLFFSKLKVGEEAVFSFDVLNCANNIGFVIEPLYHYVQYGSGQHKQGNEDPWFAVVKSMENHLTEIGEIDKYRETINSFANRALMINIYRITQNGNPFIKNRLRYVEAKKKYKHQFPMYPIDKKSVDKESLICSYLIKFNLFLMIYGAAKYKLKKRQ